MKMTPNRFAVLMTVKSSRLPPDVFDIERAFKQVSLKWPSASRAVGDCLKAGWVNWPGHHTGTITLTPAGRAALAKADA